MNKTKYLQTDNKWGGLGYPKAPCYVRNVGCGMVAIANLLIEMKQYEKYTPATIQPYCKRYGAPNCDGTYFSGIPAMMKHYGLTEVKECDTMPELWKELKKGGRVAVYLMGSRKGGSKGVHWTSGGHLVCSVGYKYEDKKHYVYMKDSYSNSKLRNGWISYEENMKNDVVKVWVGKLAEATEKPASSDGKLAVDGIGGECTIRAMQKYFGVTENGYIWDQLERLDEYYPSITSVRYGKGKSGSAVIKKLQKWLGLTQDGIIGKGTTAAWQKKLRDYGYLAEDEKIDGIFGVKSMKAWQKFLNNDGKKIKKETDTSTEPKTYKVIDVSDWQGKIDWKKAKADGVVGAIIRYADGDTLDKRFQENMANAKAAGLHIGAYIFSRAKTKSGAEKEATKLFKACKPYAPDMPLYIDLEAKGLEKYADTVAKAFINKMKSYGGRPGVYANLNWWNNYLKETAKLSFAMWVAQYNETMDYKPKADVGMWQYTSSGKVNGISGKVDMDKCYVPYWNADPLEPWYNVMEAQYAWSKNQKYHWITPTIENSEDNGTCVTFPAVSLQRLGILPSGGYLQFSPTTKKFSIRPKDWLEKHPDIFEISYPNKTVAELGDKIKKGDIVGFDDPNHHTMVYMGKNSKGEPIYNTMGHTKGLCRTYPEYAGRKINMIVRLKKTSL